MYSDNVVNIFIFRRDLRIEDNLALNALQQIAPKTPILPIFIFNPIQIDPKKNKYFGHKTVKFMVECLRSLRLACNDALLFFHGYDLQILEKILKHYVIDTIAFNRDVTPFAKQRDQQIEIWCEKHKINMITEEDYTLFPSRTILSESSKPYEMFTPFYRKCLAKVNMIKIPEYKNIKFFKTKVLSSQKDIDSYFDVPSNTQLAVEPGRQFALEILKKIKTRYFQKYEKIRDFPAVDGTTKLSPYLKFGCVSIREVFDTINKTHGVNHGLVRELFWREFYASIMFNFPQLLNSSSNNTFKHKYNNIPWDNNEMYFKAWCNGKTGYPIVDAAMRQLVSSGWMHNRCRMIVSMFLVKDLLVDWRKGEQFFASHLIDYDPSSNNGGWQWSSSTGTDSTLYFRVFSPILQAQKFDPDALYIKKWIPELKNVPAHDILHWNEKHLKHSNIPYPSPIVDHKSQVEKSITLFRKYT